MATLYVRVIQKQATESFHRCGMRFTKEWSVIDADAATAKRLKEEQMLEVSVEKPEDFEEVADQADGGADGPGTGAAAGADAPKKTAKKVSK